MVNWKITKIIFLILQLTFNFSTILCEDEIINEQEVGGEVEEFFIWWFIKSLIYTLLCIIVSILFLSFGFLVGAFAHNSLLPSLFVIFLFFIIFYINLFDNFILIILFYFFIH